MRTYEKGVSTPLVIGVIVVVVVAIAGFVIFGGNKDDAMMENESMSGEMESLDAMDEGDVTMEEEAMMEGDDAMKDDAMMMDEDSATVKEFTLTGKSFEFSETEMRVNKGDTVRINFSSTDGTHDWVVDAFDAATDRVTTGQATSVEFVADQAGTFEYYCSVGNHRAQGMVGTLIVQ